MFRPWIDKYPSNVNPQLGEVQYSSLVEMIEASFKEYANNCAFINMDKQLSYSQLEKSSAAVDSGSKAIFIISNFARTLEKVVTETDVEHVILSRIGDELTLLKRNLVNFIITYVKKMVPK